MASAASKLAAVTAIPEPKDIDYPVDFNLFAYNHDGQAQANWNFGPDALDVRVMTDTTQASTVEIDLDDSDYVLLQDKIFSHWAFDIENVALDSSKKFKTSSLSNSTNNAFLGDDSDLEWVLGQRPIDFDIGQIVFRLCGLSTQDTTLTLTLEDRAASWLRDQQGFKTVHRGHYTRAGFVALLCKEAGVDYWIPELDVTQPVETNTDPLSPTQKRLVTGKGLTTHQGLTVGGSPMKQSQIDLANVLLDVGSKKGANGAAMEAIICAAILESGLSLGTSNGTYWGVLSGKIGIWAQNDSVGMAGAFFDGNSVKGFQGGGAIAQSKKTNNPLVIASQVEAPTPFDGQGISTQYESESIFPLVAAEAAKIVQSYGGPSGGSTSTTDTTVTVKTPYAFTRGPNEDTYDCIQRLASEVSWYAFVRQNRLWFVSGNYLFQQDPQMTIERGKNGVDTIDVDLDMGARDSIAELTVIARTDLWAALPGMVVQVNKRGPATGKWFVASTTSHPLDKSQQATIMLQKPVPKRSEPASTDTTKTIPGGTAPGTASVGGYVNPLSKIQGLTQNRVDMGVDYGGTGPLLAIGSGTITNLTNSGWPGGAFIGLKLDSGTYAGKIWYYAEYITPTVHIGQHVNAGDQVGMMTGVIEIGWTSDGVGTTVAAANNQQFPNGDPGDWTSAAGASANRFLVSLGAKPGVMQAGGVHSGNGMPKGYP